MSAQLVIHGLEELRHVLKNLPADLAQQAEPIIDNRAEIAKSAIIQGYPGPRGKGRRGARTGNLRKGVRIRERRSGPYGPGRIVSSTAPHAWLYEYGSETIRITKKGISRGRMPPAPIASRFIPQAIRHKRILIGELVALLERHGLIVKGID